MPHNLLIKFEIELEEKYKKILKPAEVVRGEPAKLILYVTNVGKEKFPGGTIKELRAEYGLKGLRRVEHTLTPPSPLTCPPLSPDETHKLYSWDLSPDDEGIARIVLIVEAEDKQPINVYQTPKSPIGENEWSNFFYVVSREHVLEIMLLQELLKRKT
ncbi:MAG: hypothetical protein AOA66_0060 [Candidatus Bathyarchaeota archaeon BA2]|nr:MAG: hypothetical protein AOA66_0060 [Candidatus Bathyarchaeota archaeon BA2]